MASTCFGHLHVHLQEFLYIGCFTARSHLYQIIEGIHFTIETRAAF